MATATASTDKPKATPWARAVWPSVALVVALTMRLACKGGRLMVWLRVGRIAANHWGWVTPSG